MPEQPLVFAGSAELSRRARPFAAPPPIESLDRLRADMIDTLSAAGGVGLAAPQIGLSVRVILVHLHGPRAGKAPRAPEILVEPLLTPTGRDVSLGWEGCLSLPGLVGQVPRFEAVSLKAWDSDGHLIDRVETGFAARVLQHEVDHLDGILYPERMVDRSMLAVLEGCRAPMSHPQQTTKRPGSAPAWPVTPPPAAWAGSADAALASWRDGRARTGLTPTPAAGEKNDG